MEPIARNWFSEKQKIHAALLRDLLIEVFKRKPKDLVFKGGTAISFFYGSNRFSADIDLSSRNMDNYALIDDAIESFERTYSYKITNDWEDEILQQQGFRRYVLISKYGAYDGISTTIDYSPGICILSPGKKDLSNDYAAAKIDVMQPEEILAEKVRSIYTRQKGRDLYDLHYLSVIRKMRIGRGIIAEKMEEEPRLKGKKYSFNSFRKRVEALKPYWGDLDGILSNFTETTFDAVSNEVLEIFRNV